MKPKNLSAASQRSSILQHLLKAGPLTTLYAREKMGIMSPSARVLELRQQGYSIITHWTTSTDVSGTKHRVAVYVLFNHSRSKTNPCSVENYSSVAGGGRE